MALIVCPDCSSEISDKAAACPKCGHPVAGKSPTAASSEKPPTPPSTKKPLVGPFTAVLLGLVIAGVVAYKFVFSDETKRQIAGASGVAAPLVKAAIPWGDRADPAVRSLLARSSGALGRSIQVITHPTGRDGVVQNVQVRRIGPEEFSVKIDVAWKGGFLGSSNTTTVTWQFSRQKHGSATVSGDSGAMGVGQSNRQRLDEYFRDEVYAVLMSNLGAGG